MPLAGACHCGRNRFEVDGEKLPEDVVVSFLRQLTNAGGDTTYRGTSVLSVADTPRVKLWAPYGLN